MKPIRVLMTLSLFFLLSVLGACDVQADSGTSVSSSGVHKATAKVTTGSDGLTTEQRNIKHRLEVENQPGGIKHLYVISAMSGQVLIYSTVSGKVTSSGKRLTPTSVVAGQGYNGGWFSWGMDVDIGGNNYRTTEVLQDDGTYGSSVEYLFWFDAKGVYHQHYVAGGQIVHVSDQPLAVKSIVLNLSGEPQPGDDDPDHPPVAAKTPKHGAKPSTDVPTTSTAQ